MKRKIDIWEIVKEILSEHNPVISIAYLAVRAYGHSTKQVSSLFQIPLEKLEEKVSFIDEEIKHEVIRKGGNPSLIGAFSTTHSVSELFSFAETEEEENSE